MTPEQLEVKMKEALRKQFPLGEWLKHYENLIVKICLLIVLQAIEDGEVVRKCVNPSCTFGQVGYRCGGEIHYKDCPECNRNEFVLKPDFANFLKETK